MTKYLMILFVSFLVSNCATMIATTTEGRQVRLYYNYMWEYADEGTELKAPADIKASEGASEGVKASQEPVIPPVLEPVYEPFPEVVTSPPEPIIPMELPKYAGEAVTVWDSSFSLHDNGEFDREVRLYVHFNNLTEKKVIAIQVHVNIKDSFGNEVFDNSLEEEIIIGPQERKKNDTYSLWKDNPFIDGEFYDRTWTLAQNGTAKITCKILKVVFEDGKVLKAKGVQ